jgi:hypothetical protein
MLLRRDSVLMIRRPCQAVFPSVDVELFPTTKGNFHAGITQVGMNRIWMHRIHISLPEINIVAVKPGRRPQIDWLSYGMQFIIIARPRPGNSAWRHRLEQV